MGLSAGTLFVRTDDPAVLLRTVVAILTRSGWERVEGAAIPPALPWLRTGHAASSATWAVALTAGAPGWCALTTTPPELFCEPGPDGAPRLAALARALSCSAFQLNVYDGDSTLLMESDAEGRTAASGFCSWEL